MKRPFLTAEWRHLVMANYEVDPAVLQPVVPTGIELDFCKGKTFLSLVAFRFQNARLWKVPIPFHRNFEEVNLRFYVRRKVSEGWRRGVVFIKEYVPRFAIAWAARQLYNENYVACRMSSAIRVSTSALGKRTSVEYTWYDSSTVNAISAEFSGEPSVPTACSEAEFIAEHYWGYVKQLHGGALEYAVKHPPWRVWPATTFRVEGDLTACYGSRYCAALGARPTSVFVAEGSQVAVYRGEPLAVSP